MSSAASTNVESLSCGAVRKVDLQQNPSCAISIVSPVRTSPDRVDRAISAKPRRDHGDAGQSATYTVGIVSCRVVHTGLSADVGHADLRKSNDCSQILRSQSTVNLNRVRCVGQVRALCRLIAFSTPEHHPNFYTIYLENK